jgi:hypothetical protein
MTMINTMVIDGSILIIKHTTIPWGKQQLCMSQRPVSICQRYSGLPAGILLHGSCTSQTVAFSTYGPPFGIQPVNEQGIRQQIKQCFKKYKVNNIDVKKRIEHCQQILTEPYFLYCIHPNQYWLTLARRMTIIKKKKYHLPVNKVELHHCK